MIRSAKGMNRVTNPSADQVLAYAGTLKRKPVGGRVKENVNPMTEWYYGNKTVAAWCAIYECYVFNHFPGMLSSVGGKNAAAAGWEHRAPTHGKWYPRHAVKDAEPGDVMEMDFNHNGSADHTEFFLKRIDSDHFWARGGNVGGDNVADNVRSYSDAYGFFRPNYGPTDHTVYSGTLYWYRKGHPMQHSLFVKQMQEWLVGYGYLKNDKDHHDVDEYYGPKTAAAIKAFQKDHHLEIDGKVGPKTWAALKVPPSKK